MTDTLRTDSSERAYRNISPINKIHAVTLRNLDKQGFDGLDDAAKARQAWPLRFTPAVCVSLIVIGLALQSPWWLAGMALVALSGALLPGGMVIDTLYNIGVRHLLGAPPVAPAPKPRQFSYLISTAFLSASAVIFRNAAATGPSWSSAINRSRRSSGLWQQSKTEPETQRRQP